MKTKNLALRPDTLEHLGKTDLVQLSRNLLGAVVESSRMEDPKIDFDENRVKEAKIVLGYLNATINATKAKMQYFKLVGVDEKINKIKIMNQRL